jgi:hypothetical protein
MKALYGAENPSSASDVIEGRLIAIALRTLRLGINVALDSASGAAMNGPPCATPASRPRHP